MVLFYDIIVKNKLHNYYAFNTDSVKK